MGKLTPDTHAEIDHSDIPGIGTSVTVAPAPNGSDDTTALQAAIDALITAGGGTLALRPGTYLTTTLTIDGVLNIEGAGAELTTIKALAGTSTRLLNYTSATRRNHNKLRHLSINAVDAPTIQALRLHNQSRFLISDVHVQGGAVGLYVETCSGLKFADMIFRSQATSSVRIQGDGGLELYFERIDIRNDDATLTPTTGFEVQRTTTTDVGAIYMDGVKVTKGSGGAITNGIKFSCSSGTAAMPTFMTQCVSDLVLGGAAVVFQRVSSFYLSECYFTTDSTNASPAVYIDGGNSIQLYNSFCYALNASASGAIEFANAPSKLFFEGIRCPGGTVFSLPASNPPTDMTFGSCQFNDATAIANDLSRLVSACGVGGRGNVVGPHKVLVATGGGNDQWFVITEPSGKRRGFRITSGATLEMMNDAGSEAVLRVSDAGVVSASAAGGYFQVGPGLQQMRSGGNSPEGVVTAPVGSLFLRTNGGAGSTLYVKESGTGNTGWVAK